VQHNNLPRFFPVNRVGLLLGLLEDSMVHVYKAQGVATSVAFEFIALYLTLNKSYS
jgi:hypothetical protein